MSDALKAATEALALQLEITRDHGSLTWSEADWMLDAHGDDILAALRERDAEHVAALQQAIAAEREACAKAPVGGSNPPPGLVHKDDPFSAYNRGWADGVRDLRAAIRARGASEREGRDA